MGYRTLPSVVITSGLRPKSAMKFGHNKLLSLHGMCGHAVFSLIMLNKSCPGSSPQVSASGTVPACAAVVELRDPKPSASDTSLVSKQSMALAGSSCWHPPAHSSVLSCPSHPSGGEKPHWLPANLTLVGKAMKQSSFRKMGSNSILMMKELSLFI